MKRDLYRFRHSLLGAALLLAASLASPGAQAACGLRPGQLMDEILAAAQQTPAALAADPNVGTRYLNQNGVPKWRNCLDPDFKTWRNGGSFNLPVIAAAVGLYREPNRRMPWPSDGTASPNTYVQWWVKFLGPQTGAAAAPADTPRLRYFKAAEPFSNIYDGSVVTSVISVRFWAQAKSSTPHATLLDYTKRYLRAQWAVSALASGTGPAKWYVLDGRTATSSQTQVPLRDTQYSPWAPLKSNGTPKYPGHFLALPGARSDLGHWTADDRAPLFDRAIAWTVSYTNEHQSQRAVLNYLNPLWPAGATESLYGLTSGDRTFLRNIITSGAGAADVVTPGAARPWLVAIRTIKTFRLLGWAQSPSGAAVQFRASNMEGNPNGNTTCMYGVSYDPSTATPTASFLFPFYDRHGAKREGRSWLEPGLMWATYPADGVHPGGTVKLSLPTTQPLFHIVLSAEAAPFDEKAAPVFFPSYEPYDPWPFDPQTPDVPPDDDWPPEV
jgi:hypothetical protein